MGFADHFSSVARTYATFRPTYPDTLFAWLAKTAPAQTQVWDCACGNGQASQGLAKYFDHVIATDASAAQIAAATPTLKIEYRVAPAEQSGLAERSVDLVTVAQALHWFNFEAFYTEARRILKPRGLIAAWGLGWVRIENNALDSLTLSFQTETLRDYWAPEISYVIAEYKTIPFPFEEISIPSFSLETSWSFSELMGYFRSFSATAKFVNIHGSDPVKTVEEQLAPLWGDPNKRYTFKWPFHMRAGRV